MKLHFKFNFVIKTNTGPNEYHTCTFDCKELASAPQIVCQEGLGTQGLRLIDFFFSGLLTF